MKVLATISYEKHREIGIGKGMNSKVYLAHDPQLGGTIVVKEIPKGSFGNSLQSFYEEAHAIFSSEHRHVVPIKYACQTDAQICLAMPYLSNGSLADRIQDSSLSLKELICVGQGILTGLRHIHIKGYIHFDIKPSNILFSDLQVPMIADFGQAREMGIGGVAHIPPIYQYAIPPELFLHGQGLVQSDVYQAGLTLYRAVNGDPLFQEQVLLLEGQLLEELRTKVLAGQFPDRSRFLPHVPNQLKLVIKRALSIDLEKRFRTSQDFLDALGRVKIPLNWKAIYLPNQEMRWVAAREDNRPSLIVELVKSTGRWMVKIYTQRPNSIKRASRKELWGGHLTKAQAESHLRMIFRSLA